MRKTVKVNGNGIAEENENYFAKDSKGSVGKCIGRTACEIVIRHAIDG